ncbi:MAG: adenylate/guanylate cyclase domain-containing protein [Gammaproteobacteria bacterium]|nr:adenylate/guanylate cyclase domain-containing protein [Gammaproteobacteria bacterium]
MIDKAHAEFDRLIADLSAAADDAEYGEIKKLIWENFGTSGAAFISDMANFSSTSRSLGICHFLKMIHRARQLVAPLIESNNGILLKSDADNCYAFFEDPGNAIQASIDINAELFRANQEHDIDEQIFLSVGIDYGDLLLVGHSDFYGDPVNSASKLGEDLAVKGEVLVTERALNRTALTVNENIERMIARISDIELSYVRIPMTQAVTGRIA